MKSLWLEEADSEEDQPGQELDGPAHAYISPSNAGCGMRSSRSFRYPSR